MASAEPHVLAASVFRYMVIELVLDMLVQLMVMRAGEDCTVAVNCTAARSELVWAKEVPETRNAMTSADHTNAFASLAERLEPPRSSGERPG